MEFGDSTSGVANLGWWSLFLKRGTWRVCSNYRGIKLLSLPGKGLCQGTGEEKGRNGLNSSGEKAVFQSGSFGLYVSVLFSRGKWYKQSIARVGRVGRQYRRAFFWIQPRYIESGRGLPTIPCAVFTTRAKSFRSCAVQLPYHTVALTQRMLSVLAL
ncbi:hypothetical protein L3Q82_025342 [Scortum barcoo]|uniref:Uncharacterized protein n=1 Tax=Scortum barcoo TaxID=214431 RepID=A0ACB8WP73_9TELE|nr:hypothetical protein L3Q82_025342 [Scortum barcoo]